MMRFQRSVFPIGKHILNLSQRTLFTERYLRLEGFIARRLNFRIIKNDDHLNYEIKKSSTPALVKSTLQWTLAASKSDEHIDLLRQSLIRIYANASDIQNVDDTRKLFDLGPMTMCLFHHLGMPDKALEFYHEFNNQYFDTNRTTLILMDLLFEHDRFSDLLEVYRMRSVDRQRQPTFTQCICFNAACYKLNTPETLQYAINEWDEQKSGRSLDFVAMLAFNQKKYDLVSRLLGNKEFLSAINIKLLAMAELNDWNGVSDLLYKIIKNRSTVKSYRILIEVFQKIKQSLILSKQNPPTHEWERCYRALVQIHQLVDVILIPRTMDKLLCSTINLKDEQQDEVQSGVIWNLEGRNINMEFK